MEVKITIAFHKPKEKEKQNEKLNDSIETPLRFWFDNEYPLSCNPNYKREIKIQQICFQAL